MKHILIVSHAMELGGAERSLLGLLNAINPKTCCIDLFLLRHDGELMEYIPEYVNLLPQIPQYTVLARPMKHIIKEGHFLLTAARLYGKYKACKFNKINDLNKSYVDLEYSHKYTKRFMPNISPNIEYDLVISFLTPHYFAVEKVNAKTRVAWIHTDYGNINIDIESELKMWDKYDKIAAVSDNVLRSFVETFPKLKKKVFVFENILSPNMIFRQSLETEQDFNINDSYIKLLSVGRFCDAKNFDNVPEICKLIREQDLNIKWYLIGYGGDEQLINDKIAEYDMQKYVVVLGKKSNPYPYIKDCDLYVQPSRYEGKAVTVREAQMLCKPVVITNFSTSASQLKDGYDGVIVPMDNKGCADGIVKVLEDKELMHRLSQNCRKNDYSNSNEIEKLYELIIN